jgi:ribosomal protein S18 acetylase RimI-like enzyme
MIPATPRAVVIGRAGVDDIPAILELQKLAYRSEARLYDDWSLPPLTQTLESLRAELMSSTALTAKVGARLVGSVRARIDDGICRIGRLIVHPESQRRGLGALLMEHIEREFGDSRKFELFTGSRSAGNIRLYERLGYKRTREEMVSRSITLVFMEKSR